MNARLPDASLAIALLALCGIAQGAGDGPIAGTTSRTIEGIVSYDGPRPDPIPVPEAVASRALIEVDPGTNGLKDAVVWLEGVATPRAAGAARGEAVVVDQRNFFFVPHVVAVESGRAVEFRNSDTANHGVRATSLEPENCFNVTTPPGGRHVHRFVASKYPVAIGCPVHSAMAAWVFVFDHPYHAVTDDHGRFTLPPVTPGRYTLHVRHPDGGMRRTLEIEVNEGADTHLRIAFHEGDLARRNR
jgi:plastocyanin